MQELTKSGGCNFAAWLVIFNMLAQQRGARGRGGDEYKVAWEAGLNPYDAASRDFEAAIAHVNQSDFQEIWQQPGVAFPLHRAGWKTIEGELHPLQGAYAELPNMITTE